MKRVKEKIKPIILFGVILSLLRLLFSCSLDYEKAMLVEELSEEIPDTIIYNFTQTKVIDGNIRYRVYAARAENYEKRKQTVLTDVHFREYNEEGEVITEGRADQITFFTETENAQLSGNLDFYSALEEARISGEYLIWNNERKTLSSEKQDLIKIEKDSGSKVMGRGFEADFTQKSIFFSEEVAGEWVDEEE
ncbi:MAG: LPS export ABC transporter periplasmic protein LptC [Spirochaetes bacterium]|nr:MAG: LPS export ABC transporter periplasmic protein LptC [Spirochaetota bacterium]